MIFSAISVVVPGKVVFTSTWPVVRPAVPRIAIFVRPASLVEIVPSVVELGVSVVVAHLKCATIVLVIELLVSLIMVVVVSIEVRTASSIVSLVVVRPSAEVVLGWDAERISLLYR